MPIGAKSASNRRMRSGENTLSGSQITAIAKARSTTFFAKVCQLVSKIASPKHPQSATSLVTASHSVMGVITIINASAPTEAHFLSTPSTKNAPIVNSTTMSRIARMSACVSPMLTFHAVK